MPCSGPTKRAQGPVLCQSQKSEQIPIPSQSIRSQRHLPWAPDDTKREEEREKRGENSTFNFDFNATQMGVEVPYDDSVDPGSDFGQSAHKKGRYPRRVRRLKQYIKGISKRWASGKNWRHHHFLVNCSLHHIMRGKWNATVSVWVCCVLSVILFEGISPTFTMHCSRETYPSTPKKKAIKMIFFLIWKKKPLGYESERKNKGKLTSG